MHLHPAPTIQKLPQAQATAECLDRLRLILEGVYVLSQLAVRLWIRGIEACRQQAERVSPSAREGRVRFVCVLCGVA